MTPSHDIPALLKMARKVLESTRSEFCRAQPVGSFERDSLDTLRALSEVLASTQRKLELSEMAAAMFEEQAQPLRCSRHPEAERLKGCEACVAEDIGKTRAALAALRAEHAAMGHDLDQAMEATRLALAEVERLKAEAADFHMAYRLKSDEQSKAAIIRAEAAEHREAALRDIVSGVAGLSKLILEEERLWKLIDRARAALSGTPEPHK